MLETILAAIQKRSGGGVCAVFIMDNQVAVLPIDRKSADSFIKDRPDCWVGTYRPNDPRLVEYVAEDLAVTRHDPALGDMARELHDAGFGYRQTAKIVSGQAGYQVSSATIRNWVARHKPKVA